MTCLKNMINELENIYKEINYSKISYKKLGLFEEERGTIFSKWIGKGRVVIDLGCRSGKITKWFLEGNSVLGIDIDKNSLSFCPENIKIEQNDLNSDWQIGKKDQYDFAVCTEVLEHLYDQEKFIKKVAFVLKKDGYFIGSVPNAFNLKNRLRLFFARKKNTTLGEPTHINHFSYQELLSLLENNFEEVKIVPLVQKKWKFFARFFPGLGSFLLVFKAKK